MSERMRVLSPLVVYNTFYRVYFSYFYGHGLTKKTKIPEKWVSCCEEFVQVNFAKLENSLSRFEDFLLWLFSKYGPQPIATLNNHVDEFLRTEKKASQIQPFSIEVGKFIRRHNLKSWDDYIKPKDGHYPLIIQQYIKEKNIPFEFILYLKVIDRLPAIQKKMIKAVFGKELYRQKEKWAKVEKNIGFFKEEMRRINEDFKANQ